MAADFTSILTHAKTKKNLLEEQNTKRAKVNCLLAQSK